jgi:hypothetical protein
VSLFTNSNYTCGQCGHLYAMEVVGSVNADRRPDLRTAILDETFQESACPSCANTVRMEPSFTYVDAGRGQWIASMPAREMAEYRAGERHAAELFSKSYGALAPAAAQAVGAGLQPRLTYGWPAVREKLLIRELGLDDATVELMKLDLLRRMPDAPLRPGVELRLVSMEEDRMRFEWVGAEDEAVINGLSIGRELYDAIAADSAGWAALRGVLLDGFFVDMQKTYMAEG